MKNSCLVLNHKKVRKNLLRYYANAKIIKSHMPRSFPPNKNDNVNPQPAVQLVVPYVFLPSPQTILLTQVTSSSLAGQILTTSNTCSTSFLPPFPGLSTFLPFPTIRAIFLSAGAVGWA